MIVPSLIWWHIVIPRPPYLAYSWQNVGIWLAGQVCIADAIAASSCFPPLFRPIQIPVKYPGPNGAIDTVIPLTDGGVYDNLGA